MGSTPLPVRLLALDSSTEALSVAVAHGEREWTRVVPGGARASSQILVLALEGLAACGLTMQQLDAVAFGAGPGAFTGLRCACAVAQGLAFAAGVPVLAIDSLLIVAQSAQLRARLGGEVWVAMDARMQEVYAAHYRFEAGRWHTVVAPALYTLEALASRWHASPPRVVTGNAMAVFATQLPLAGAATPTSLTEDRALGLLTLARQAHAAGAGVAADAAQPVYLRDKVALTTAEREARSQGAA